MNIIYISSLCSVEAYNRLFKNTTLGQNQQIQKYHRLLVDGFVNNECYVTIYYSILHRP